MGVLGVVEGMESSGFGELLAIILEGVFSEPIENHRTQVASGDDAVRVDVVASNGHAATGDDGTFGIFHGIPPIRSRLGHLSRTGRVRR